ncbi:potassium channel family protein [Nitrosococcus oceani]|uniref:K+ transport systems NAD-binding component, TrkA-N n=2 Tax=Nitrosococcus oceani TaxID=1229 RepID=Q3JAN4_NITOC|nr:TrkA family potassium uptake protein [Nitrosococcus oceani]KFI19442.1 potassium transporter [Nitrosococcus oceani C-27]ABA58112.1 K+ transport systems NAD-binding component, TrkA-N [Nitrosococcus oceani ATCC 19707]EDZ68031.1 TrkA-N domain family [Nitrosococcus oceani AFC27]KFI22687.1 potassium transporter [Nitrosococcus oceani]GEM21284.1 potassium transporter [Nitrosococcus oceani]
MRAVFVGAGSLAVMTARLLLKRGHEVVFIECEKERVDALAEELDCGFLHGDGSKPAILRQADPAGTHILYCLMDNDQANILASLMGRSLGFRRVVTKIEEPELEHLCIELGLDDTIIPDRTIGRYLADMFDGRDPLELSTMIRDVARVFSFAVGEKDEGSIETLDLPERSRIICVYRNNEFLIPESETQLKAKDEVVIITHRQNLAKLEERWTLQRQQSIS